MNRSDLIALIARNSPSLSQSDVAACVATILDGLAETLAHGGRIEIRGFGAFTLHHRAARIGRNPKTGERVQVAGKATVHFKMGKELKERVDSQTRL